MIVLLFKMMFQDILFIMMRFLPDHFKRKKMYNEAVRNNPYALRHVPDNFKTQEICDKAIKIDPFILWSIPDWYKTQEMCDKTVEKVSWSLEYVSDCFVTQGQIKIWRDDDDDHCNDDRLIKWYEDYKKRKAQKTKIKEERLPITWNPDRVMDWCIPEDEKGGVIGFFCIW